MADMNMSSANEASTLQPNTSMQKPMMARHVHAVHIYDMNMAPK